MVPLFFLAHPRMITCALVDNVSAISCTATSARPDAGRIYKASITCGCNSGESSLAPFVQVIRAESAGAVKDSLPSKQSFLIDPSMLPAEEILFGKTDAMLEVSNTIRRTCDTSFLY